jgi:hypothetical protein
MTTSYYSAYYWDSPSSKLRIIVCDDLTDLGDSCRKALGSGVKKLDSRLSVYAAFHLAGKDPFLIIDGTLAEPVGVLEEAEALSVEEWCSMKPKFTKAEKASRIIVWSGAPAEEHSFLRWYVKTASSVEDLRAIKSLALQTVADQLQLDRWPNSLQGRTEIVTQVIHSLDNMLLPVKLDVETLSNAHSTEQRSIWKEYFAKGEGYLTAGYRGLNGRDFIGEVKRKLVELEALAEDAELKSECQSLLEVVAEARRSQQRCNLGELKIDLERVIMTGSAVVRRLRKLRNDQKAH